MKSNQLLQYLNESLPRTSDAIKLAVVDVMYYGSKWRAAASRHSVTEGGILRAMQRSKVREHFAKSRIPS